jgi:hypothetical protein
MPTERVDLHANNSRIVRGFPAGGTVKLDAVSPGARVNAIGIASLDDVGDSVAIGPFGTAHIALIPTNGTATITLEGVA